MAGVLLRVRGLVQGVGFRPHVWRLAREEMLAGEVRNDGEGVTIEAWGDEAALERFCQRLRDEAPVLARIEGIARAALDGPPPGDAFRIVASAGGRPATGIAPDAATCPACRAEIADPAARRFGYAFTNCTQCGPRLSIVTGIPYDRARTSMARFALCPDCRAEYADPADRRFHAQPIACPACGPRLWLEPEEAAAGDSDPIAAAASLLADGKILAVKGIGGFHLACDAADDAAVRELRRRKQRGDKPFALMMPDLAAAARHVVLEDGADALLESPAAPILLLPLREAGAGLSAAIAPGQATLGVMLPYSPLHHLLMQAVETPLVMTSGNTVDEPQCIDNAEARIALAGLADAFLMHDRDIVNRVDDSVLRIAAGRPRIMRRARGYAPGRIALPLDLPGNRRILALGADLKNTFCLAEKGAAVLSQHLGDLGNPVALAEAQQAQRLYRTLYAFEPEIVAVDCHPDYAATRLGERLAGETGAALVPVQHHHAHIAACLAENNVAAAEPPVLGIALDGMGWGPDGTVWGGEFLVCDYRAWERVGRFAAVPLPGGDQAAREPWRNLYAHLRRLGAWGDLVRRYDRIETLDTLSQRPLPVLERMIAGGINAPLTSSAGRLFDAAAALLGIVPERLTFEAEAAQKLESLAMGAAGDAGAYSHEVRAGALAELDWLPLWREMLADLQAGTADALVARRFHNGIAAAIGRLARDIAERRGLRRVALSGGVFHNRLLLESVSADLAAAGLDVLTQSAIPCGDGGIALGQAAVAAAQGAAGP